MGISQKKEVGQMFPERSSMNTDTPETRPWVCAASGLHRIHRSADVEVEVVRRGGCQALST